jgi:hypothetical protein
MAVNADLVAASAGHDSGEVRNHAPARAGRLDVRATGAAGATALAGLPFLMAASVLSGAHLAAPAIIATGYLAVAVALSLDRMRSAAVMHAAVLAGLVGSSMLMFLSGSGAASWAGLAAALLGPFFASMPALLEGLLKRAAHDRDTAVSLEALAASEAVVLLDKEGRVIGATRAAHTLLGRRLAGTGEDMARGLDIADRSALLAAFSRCAAGGGPVECQLSADRATGPLAATLLAGERGTVSIRLRRMPRPDDESTTGGPRFADAAAEADDRSAAYAATCCDIADAFDHAVRDARGGPWPSAAWRFAEFDRGLVAACPPLTGRRIVHALVACMAPIAGGGGCVELSASRRAGVVLLRATAEDAADASSDDMPIRAYRALSALVNAAGGTCIAEQRGGRSSISVRLDLAAV